MYAKLFKVNDITVRKQGLNYTRYGYERMKMNEINDQQLKDP